MSWHARLLLLSPARVERGLSALRVLGWSPLPNLWQIELGVLRMWERMLLRSDTIGVGAAPRRLGLRAALLRWRVLRFFPLLAGRHITPWDLSGFLSSKEQILRHLLGAHHEGNQCVYDLQLLRMHPGGLAELRDRAAAVVSGRDPDADWLRDLVVYEGYHERLLAAAEAMLAGAEELDSADGENPDVSFRAYLRWCAAQPATPELTWAVYRAGRFTVRGGVDQRR